YQASQINQSFRAVRIPAIRGKILDANGVALAENRPSYNVNLYLDELRPAFQSAYSNNLSWVTRQITRTNSKARLTRARRAGTGIKSVLVDSLGYRQAENVWNPADAGRNVTLTIDHAIQRAAEQALRSAPVPYASPARGAVVVMDPASGDLIAMASSPAY